jgi:hypothetical protein
VESVPAEWEGLRLAAKAADQAKAADELWPEFERRLKELGGTRHASHDRLVTVVLLCAEEDVAVIDLRIDLDDAYGTQPALAAQAAPHHVDPIVLEGAEQGTVASDADFLILSVSEADDELLGREASSRGESLELQLRHLPRHLIAVPKPR